MKEIKIKFDKTGRENEDFLSLINESYILSYSYTLTKDGIDITFINPSGNFIFSTTGVYNFKIIDGVEEIEFTDMINKRTIITGNNKIKILFRKSEQGVIDMTGNVFNEENLKAIKSIKEAKEKELEIVSTLIQEYKKLTNEERKYLENAKEKLLSEIETKDKLIKNFQSVLNMQKQ